MVDSDSEASSAGEGQAAPGRRRDYSANVGLIAVRFTCASHEDGKYCRDDTSGYGFRIASESNATF